MHVHTRFVVERVVVEQAFIRVRWLSRGSIILQLLPTLSFVYEVKEFTAYFKRHTATYTAYRYVNLSNVAEAPLHFSRFTSLFPPTRFCLVLMYTKDATPVFVNNQFEGQFFFMYIYFYSLHVSDSYVSIIRRINCINTTSGICHSV
jgi:hypothetical protein